MRALRQAAKLEPKQVQVVDEGAEPVAAGEAKVPGVPIWMTAAQHTKYMGLIEKRAAAEAEAARAQQVEDQRKQQTAEWKAKRTDLKKEVTEEFSSRADFKLDEMLRNGEVKIARDALTPDQVAALPRSYIAKDGVHPDHLAVLSGDSTGGAIVSRLISLNQVRGKATPENFLKAAINAETERRLNLGLGQDALEKAKDQVLSETQEQLLHEEVVARAAEAGVEYHATQAQVKAAIRTFFDKQLVPAVSSDEYLAAAGRAGRRIVTALEKGDKAEAFRQQRLQQNAVIMGRMASQFEKVQKRFSTLAKRYSAPVLKNVDTEYVTWAHDLLARTGQRMKPTRFDIDREISKGE